jgi:hypothetical protein
MVAMHAGPLSAAPLVPKLALLPPLLPLALLLAPLLPLPPPLAAALLPFPLPPAPPLLDAPVVPPPDPPLLNAVPSASSLPPSPPGAWNPPLPDCDPHEQASTTAPIAESAGKDLRFEESMNAVDAHRLEYGAAKGGLWGGHTGLRYQSSGGRGALPSFESILVADW